MYIYFIYSRYMLYRSLCPLLIWSYIIQDEAVNPLTHQAVHCFKWEFCVQLHDIFQEHIPAIKRDLPVLLFQLVHSFLTLIHTAVWIYELCEISGFCHSVVEVFAWLVCYTAVDDSLVGKQLPTDVAQHPKKMNSSTYEPVDFFYIKIEHIFFLSVNIC